MSTLRLQLLEKKHFAQQNSDHMTPSETSGGNNCNDSPENGDGTASPGGGATTIGGGTAISGGGTPDTARQVFAERRSG